MTDAGSTGEPTLETLTPASDQVFGGQGLREEDVVAIRTAVALVREGLQASDQSKAVLLHIGVGVGNPGGAWGNPTAQPRLDLNVQMRPAFVDDALATGLRVVVLDFNKFDRTERIAAASADEIRVNVCARFPLTTVGDLNRAGLDEVRELKGTSAYLSLMNAVSQVPYPGCFELVTRQGKDAYVTSYAETGTQQAYTYFARRSGGVQLLKMPPPTGRDALTRMADVFAGYGATGD